MSIQIRRASLQDVSGIENIEKQLQHRILSFDTLSSTLDKNTYYYFVAIINNIIVGYISAELLVDHLDILAVAVLEDYRRQSIATHLTDKLFEQASILNIQDIFLEVRENNTSAIKFYEGIGFEKISSRKNYYKDTNEDAYIYTKKQCDI